MPDVFDGGLELGGIGLQLLAGDEDHLVRLLGKALAWIFVACPDSPTPLVSSVSCLRSDLAADHEGEDHEREPSEDRDLAVPGAPASSARR
jgi:hypothetical protein